MSEFALVSSFEEQEDGMGTEVPNRPSSLASPVSPTAPTIRASRLAKYLDDLAVRPNDPPFDVNDNGLRKSLSGGFSFGSTPSHTLANLASTSSTQSRNPEADSFAYIETLLESLAVLGKLGTGLDIVAQKLPNEIFSLVEATVEEVSESPVVPWCRFLSLNSIFWNCKKGKGKGSNGKGWQ